MGRTRHPDLQESIPVFVRNPNGLTWNGHEYDVDTEFPWLSLRVPVTKVRTLFNAGYLYHSESLEQEFKVGDGLEAMNITELEFLVDTVNAAVKKGTATETQYAAKRCRKSKIKSKQIGMIRSWRRNYGHFEKE